MIPEELNKIFEEYDEDELYIQITDMAFSENTLFVSFTLHSTTTEEINANDLRWTVQTVGHKRNIVSFDKGTIIRIEKDHPLLWEFKDVQCELYFNGQGTNPEKLHFDLYKMHFELFENYIPAETYFNSWYPYDLLKAKNGLLARGPKKLLLRYAECLKKNGVDFTVLEGISKPEDQNLAVLFIDATACYVIAEYFVFSRQEK